jgi:hypothetical protein
MWGEAYSDRVDRAGRRVLSLHASFVAYLAKAGVAAAILGFLAYDLTPRLAYATSVVLGIAVFAVAFIAGYASAGHTARKPLLRIVIDRRKGTLAFGTPQRTLPLADIDHAELSAIARPDPDSPNPDPHANALYRLDLVTHSRARIATTDNYLEAGIDPLRRLLDVINRELQSTR